MPRLNLKIKKTVNSFFSKSRWEAVFSIHKLFYDTVRILFGLIKITSKFNNLWALLPLTFSIVMLTGSVVFLFLLLLNISCAIYIFSLLDSLIHICSLLTLITSFLSLVFLRSKFIVVFDPRIFFIAFICAHFPTSEVCMILSAAGLSDLDLAILANFDFLIVVSLIIYYISVAWGYVYSVKIKRAYLLITFCICLALLLFFWKLITTDEFFSYIYGLMNDLLFVGPLTWVVESPDVFSFRFFISCTSLVVSLYNVLYVLLRANILFTANNMKFFAFKIFEFEAETKYKRFLNLVWFKKIFAWFGFAKFSFDVQVSRLSSIYLSLSIYVYTIIFILSMFVIHIHNDQIISWINSNKDFAPLFFVAITWGFRVLFSIPNSFVSICLKSQKIKLNKSRFMIRELLKSFFNRPVSPQFLLVGLRAGGYFCVAILAFILLLVGVYAIFRALYNESIDFFLLTLIEEGGWYPKVYGIFLTMFGFFVSLEFFYWVLLLYVWKLPYHIWALKNFVIFVLTPLATTVSDINSLNSISNKMKYLFGDTPYRYKMFLRPPKPDPKDPDGPVLVKIADFDWFDQPGFIFFERLSSEGLLPLGAALTAFILWATILLLNILIIRRTARFIAKTEPRNPLLVKHIALLCLILFFQFYLTLCFFNYIISAVQLFSDHKIEIAVYKDCNSQSINSFLLLFLIKALSVMLEAGFQSMLPFLLFIGVFFLFLWGILLFPLIFFDNRRNNYNSILIGLDPDLKVLLLRGFALMTIRFYQLTIWFKIIFIIKLIILILINRRRSYAGQFSAGLSYYIKYLWINIAIDKFRDYIDICNLLSLNFIILFLSLPTVFYVGDLPLYASIYQILMLSLILFSYIVLYFKYRRNTHAWLEVRDTIVGMGRCFHTSYRMLDLPQLSEQDRREFALLEGSPEWAKDQNNYLALNPNYHKHLINITYHRLSHIIRDDADISWERVITFRGNVHDCYGEIINWKPKHSGNYLGWKIALD